MAQQRGRDWSTFNKNIQRILNLVMQMKMAKRRHGFEMAEIGERQAGYERLEETRTRNTLNEIMTRFSNQLKQLPEVDFLVSTIRDKEQRGEDTSAERTRLQQTSKTVAESFLTTALGGQLGGEQAQKIVQYIGTEAAQKLIPEMGLERGKLAVKREEIGLGREALGVRREELGVRAMEALGKTRKEKRDFWEKFIQENINYLEMQGVQREAGASEIMAMFRSGKELAPLSTEHHGQALTFLTQIMSRLGQDKLPTQGEINFMTKVRNTFKIGEEEGLPSPITGEFPSEAAAGDEALRARMREQIITYIMTTYGLSRIEAERQAESYMAGIK